MNNQKLKEILTQSKRVLDMFEIATGSKEGEILYESHKTHTRGYDLHDPKIPTPHSVHKINYNGKEEYVTILYKKDAQQNKEGKYLLKDMVYSHIDTPNRTGLGTAYIWVDKGKIEHIDFKSLNDDKVIVKFDSNNGKIKSIVEKLKRGDKGFFKTISTPFESFLNFSTTVSSSVSKDVQELVMNHYNKNKKIKTPAANRA